MLCCRRGLRRAAYRSKSGLTDLDEATTIEPITVEEMKKAEKGNPYACPERELQGRDLHPKVCER